MADAARIGPVPDATTPTGHRHGAHHHNGLSFKAVLDRAFKSKADTGYLHGHGHIQPAVARIPAPQTTMPGATPGATPAETALTQAMALENVPASWQPGLHYIMHMESGGQVGVQNPHHSARGLFQLTAVNYHMNPNGAASFGNAVEEAQGGIRYIRQRYGTVANAVAHWNQYRWY